MGGLVLLALVLRLIYVFDLRASPAFQLPNMDVLYHVDWARAMISDAEFMRDRHHPLGEDSPLFRAPGYIMFLAGVFKVFGTGLLAPRLIQCVFGALTTLLVYLLGKRAFSREVGFVASAMAATYWVLIYFDGELLIPSMYVPVNLLGLWLALGLAPRDADEQRESEQVAIQESRDKPGSRVSGGEQEREDADSRKKLLRRATLTGLVFGLAAIIRPNVLLVMPIIGLWVLWSRRPRARGQTWRPALVPTVALTIGTLVPILPVTAYNTFVGNDFSLIATQGGVNFWIGNNPTSDGSTAVVPGTRAGWWSGYHDSIAQAQAAEGRNLSPTEVSDYYSKRAWDFISEEPAGALGLFGHKIKLLWNRWEMGNNQPVRFYSYHFSPLIRFLPLGYEVLAPLAVFGLLLSLRKRRLVPLSGFLIVYSLSIVIFFVCARFRVPILPVMMVFAAHALVWTWGKVRARQFASPALLLAVVASGCWISSRPLPGVEHAESTGYWNLGLAEGVRGNEDVAIGHLNKAIELNSLNVYARLTLAKVLNHKDQPMDALVQLREALKTNGDSVDAIELYLQTLGRTGQLEELERMAQQIIARHPQLSVPHLVLGTVRLGQGLTDEALQLYQRASQADPHAFTPLLALGSTLAFAGRPAEAIAPLEASLKNLRRAGPGEVELAYEKLISILTQSDRARALHFAREYKQLVPQSPRAQALLQQLGG
ncbi:MAG: 4-amino-4-deoxy-L-arabinose transferase-like glycosyltransferase/Tfp pilus assembly protein PilF [Planctomycetota bacterium]